MNRSDFLDIISHPSPSRDKISGLSELIELFPYFQGAHLLLLKMLHDNADVKFGTQLRKSAIHIADRKVLYYHLSTLPGKEITYSPAPAISDSLTASPADTGLNDEGIAVSEPAESREKPAGDEDAEAGAGITDGYAPAEAVDTMPETEEQVIIPSAWEEAALDDSENIGGLQDDQDTISDTPVNEISDDVSEVTELPVENMSETAAPDTSEIIPEKTAEESLPHDVNGGDREQAVIESGRSSEDVIREIEDESVTSESGDAPSSHSIILSDEFIDEEDRISIMMINDEQEQDEEDIFYMDPGFSLPEPVELLEMEPGLAEKLQPDEKAEPVFAETGDADAATMLSESDLIDLFISNNPRIEPRKEKSDIPVEDVSKHSVEEKGGFVTETLASIYITQGYYSKAIDIYEKLCLKFPEKSSYFASQIEKVHGLIKK